MRHSLKAIPMNANRQEHEKQRKNEALGSTTVELNPIVEELAKRLRECSEGIEFLQRFLESQVHPSLGLAVLGKIDDPEIIERIALILYLEIELDSLQRARGN